ncbi:hypothetical protein XAUC_32400 [Xanthomonas citri pv. aurantifolii str. ICPB 10535]|nr:hypothetical protein XAUC_32400 [Xanthomonas citri pv. aurantifolii str. ICPB 10535]
MNEWEAQLRLVEPRKYSNGTNCETTGRGHRLLRCTTWRPPRRVGTLPQTGGQNLRGLHILVERYRRRPRLGALGNRGSCFGTHLSHPATFPSTVQSSPWLAWPADGLGSDATPIRDPTKALAQRGPFCPIAMAAFTLIGQLLHF